MPTSTTGRNVRKRNASHAMSLGISHHLPQRCKRQQTKHDCHRRYCVGFDLHVWSLSTALFSPILCTATADAECHCCSAYLCPNLFADLKVSIIANVGSCSHKENHGSLFCCYPDGTSRNNNKKQPGQVLTPSLAMDTVVGSSVTMCNSNLFGFACGSRQHERLTVTGAARGRVSFSDIPCVLVVFKIRLLAKLYIAISPGFISMYFVNITCSFSYSVRPTDVLSTGSWRSIPTKWGAKGTCRNLIKLSSSHTCSVLISEMRIPSNCFGRQRKKHTDQSASWSSLILLRSQIIKQSVNSEKLDFKRLQCIDCIVEIKIR